MARSSYVVIVRESVRVEYTVQACPPDAARQVMCDHAMILHDRSEVETVEWTIEGVRAAAAARATPD